MKEIRSTMDNIESHLRRLRRWYKVEMCRTCECFQGALTQFKIDGENKAKKMVKGSIITKSNIHGCSGCDPCPPAEIFSSYIKNKRRLGKKK